MERLSDEWGQEPTMEDLTIAWVTDPGEESGSWAVLAADGSVVDRAETVEDAQKMYPSAFIVR